MSLFKLIPTAIKILYQIFVNATSLYKKLYVPIWNPSCFIPALTSRDAFEFINSSTNHI